MPTLEHVDRLIRDFSSQEREISHQRRQLRARLAAFPSEFGNRREREIAQERQELHRRIDELLVLRRALERSHSARLAAVT